MRKQSIKIGVAQISSGYDIPHNIDKIRQLTAQLAAEGAQLVVFPEGAMCAFSSRLPATVAQYGEIWKTQIQQIAAESGLTVVAGGFALAPESNQETSPESGLADRQPRVLNQLIAASPHTEPVFYTKIHLYDAFGYRESDTVLAGQELTTIEVDGVQVGLATCYDVRFPKLYAEYARAGVQVVVTAASWAGGQGKENQWKLLTSTRALDSNTFMVAVDQADPRTLDAQADWTKPHGIGFSRVVSPFGETLWELGGAPGAFVVELDLVEVEQARQVLPVLANARLGY